MRRRGVPLLDAGRPTQLRARGRSAAIRSESRRPRRLRRLDHARRPRALGVSADQAAAGPRGEEHDVGPQPDRSVRAGQAGGARLGPRAGGRAAGALPQAISRPDRSTADARRVRCVSRRLRAVRRRRREDGRQPARPPCLRRTLGTALARPGPVRRVQWLRARRRQTVRLAVSRLCDPSVQCRQALRSVRARANRRRRAARGR